MFNEDEISNTLLIGNGLNRCLEHSISWGDLLKEIAKDYDVKYNGEIPMPLEFESITNQILEKHKNPSVDVYEEVKKRIAEKISYAKLPDDAIHNYLKEIPFQSLLTTNYDNLLEYVFNSDYSFRGDKKKKYLFDALSIQNGISFYHIHGHADNPKTICLGYEHYMGIVENLRSSINTKEHGNADEMKIYKALKDRNLLSNKWYEKFYTDNVYIVGLGLSESESDLWWILTHRAFLFYSDYYGIKANLNNKIIYYDIVNKSKDKECVQKEKIHYMLEKCNVIVKKFIISKDCKNYEEGYRKAFDDIKKEIENGKTNFR